MLWTSRTFRDLHGALIVAAFAAILEMAGGADRASGFMTLAVVFFATSIPINFYGWYTLNDELLARKDEATALAESNQGVICLMAGASCVYFGFMAVVCYFIGYWILVFVAVHTAMWEYESRVRYPNSRVLRIWRE